MTLSSRAFQAIRPCFDHNGGFLLHCNLTGVGAVVMPGESKGKTTVRYEVRVHFAAYQVVS